MPDFYDLILVEDAEGEPFTAYTNPYAATVGDLALINDELFEIKAIVESVPKAAIDILKEAGFALSIDKIYTLAWDAKKGSVL